VTVNGEITVIDIWRVVLERRWLILIVTALFLSLALAYAVLKRPVYRSEVTLMEAEQDQVTPGLSALAPQLGGLAAIAGLSTAQTSLKSEALATLRSRAFIEGFIREVDLMPILFADDWDASKGAWQSEDPEQIPTMADAYEIFVEKIMTVTDDPKKNLITLAVDTADPERSALWANELVGRLNSKLRQRSISEAQKSIEYLNHEADKTSVVELRQAIYGLVEAQIQKIMLANVREEYALRVIDPAVAADKDDFVKPKRKLVVVLGLAFGMVAGFFLAFLAHSYQSYRNQSI
jgi:uncharacterized protein involved in exopolysaccharide biosynthesis